MSSAPEQHPPEPEQSTSLTAEDEMIDADVVGLDTEPHDVDVETLVDDLDRVTAERNGHLDDLQRLTAEFANFRKQVDKRNADVVQHAASGLVETLLPVLDACDAAVGQGSTDVDLIRTTLLDTLTKEGLEQLATRGDPFDPERHEAVLREEGEGAPVIAEVLRAGYAWKGRVIRPAMVSVRG